MTAAIELPICSSPRHDVYKAVPALVGKPLISFDRKYWKNVKFTHCLLLQIVSNDLSASRERLSASPSSDGRPGTPPPKRVPETAAVIGEVGAATGDGVNPTVLVADYENVELNDDNEAEDEKRKEYYEEVEFVRDGKEVVDGGKKEDDDDGGSYEDVQVKDHKYENMQRSVVKVPCITYRVL
jgi:hypothetical protein